MRATCLSRELSPAVDSVIRRGEKQTPQVWIGKAADGFLHRRGVGQRLAHAHEHKIGNRAIFRQQSLRRQHLPHDLMSLEIALQSHLPGQTKGAVQCASNLGGETQGQAIFIGDEHAFDALSVLQGKDEFPRAVFRRQDFGRGERSDACLRCQPRPVGMGEVRHGGDVRDAGLVEPAEDLPGAVAGPVPVAHPRGQLIRAQGDEIYRGHCERA